MEFTCSNGVSTHWITRVAATASAAALLALTAAPALAANEPPKDLVAYAVGPRAVNVLWSHSAKDVYYFVVEAESPYGYVEADRDKRIQTVANLQPSHTYRFRVCAVYDYYRTCSNEYATAPTMAPEASGSAGSAGSAPSASPPPPQAVPFPDPRIKGELVRLEDRADSPYVVRLTWLNPIADPVQARLLESVSWMRNDRGAIGNGGTQIIDREYKDNDGGAYYLCVRNAVHSRCSNAVGILPLSTNSPTTLPIGRSTANVACAIGFVWRAVRPSDLVCVTPGSRARVFLENRSAATRVEPGGGAYGPNTCRNGYVWREAFSGDLVCVTPQRRTQVAQENQLSTSRRANARHPKLTPFLARL